MNENVDFNKMLELLSKMNKKELEEKLQQAQNILNSKNIGPDDFKK